MKKLIKSILAILKKTSTQEIKRGRIYGAVKYNGEWRACVIETVN